MFNILDAFVPIFFATIVCEEGSARSTTIVSLATCPKEITFASVIIGMSNKFCRLLFNLRNLKELVRFIRVRGTKFGQA